MIINLVDIAKWADRYGRQRAVLVEGYSLGIGRTERELTVLGTHEGSVALEVLFEQGLPSDVVFVPFDRAAGILVYTVHATGHLEG